MKDVMGLIVTGENDIHLGELTSQRAVAALPIAGRYRVIDFQLSSMVHTGIKNVGIITQKNYSSLMDHVGSGREWDLSRKKGGLYILPPFGNVTTNLYRGRIEALYGAKSFITHALADYVVLTDCDTVTNMDFKPIVAKHVETGADITVVAHTGVYDAEVINGSTVLSTDAEGKVRSVLIRPDISGTCTLSLNIFVMSKKFLIDMVSDAMARGKVSFETDVLQAKCGELNIMAYEYDNYFSKISSVATYLKANQELLIPENARKLFPPKRPIYTKVSDNAPVKYDLDSKVNNSLIADGCIIEGEVENSVLFRGVKVAKGAKVKNCILMQGTVVGAKSDVNYVITDKDVTIGDSHILNGAPSYPMFVGKGASV